MNMRTAILGILFASLASGSIFSLDFSLSNRADRAFDFIVNNVKKLGHVRKTVEPGDKLEAAIDKDKNTTVTVYESGAKKPMCQFEFKYSNRNSIHVNWDGNMLSPKKLKTINDNVKIIPPCTKPQA